MRAQTISALALSMFSNVSAQDSGSDCSHDTALKFYSDAECTQESTVVMSGSGKWIIKPSLSYPDYWFKKCEGVNQRPVYDWTYSRSYPVEMLETLLDFDEECVANGDFQSDDCQHARLMFESRFDGYTTLDDSLSTESDYEVIKATLKAYFVDEDNSPSDIFDKFPSFEKMKRDFEKKQSQDMSYAPSVEYHGIQCSPQGMTQYRYLDASAGECSGVYSDFDFAWNTCQREPYSSLYVKLTGSYEGEDTGGDAAYNTGGDAAYNTGSDAAYNGGDDGYTGGDRGITADKAADVGSATGVDGGSAGEDGSTSDGADADSSEDEDTANGAKTLVIAFGALFALAFSSI